MNCRRLNRLLWSYVDGTLSAAERQACEAHLTRCARCRQRLQAAQLTRTSLQTLPRYGAPNRLLERLQAEIAAQRVGEPGTRGATIRQSPLAIRWGWRWALAPALGVLVALLWWWSQPPIQLAEGERPPEPPVQQTAQEYADTCIDLHQQLEMAEWAGTPAASYLITTGATR
ncbi:MAG: zf-HC2 domain-containing protein [Armatimonadota bacterium]